MPLHRNGLLPGLLLSILALAHPWLEQTMMRHMAIELPALFGIGWMAASFGGTRLSHGLRSWNAAGLPGLLCAVLVTMFWMVPTALDHAVLDEGAAITKVASLVLAGFGAGASWKAAGIVIQGFFVFSWCWMTLAIGLMYQDAPQQLCSVYLIDEQFSAGVTLVIWAIVVLSLWLPHAFFSTRLLDDQGYSKKSAAHVS